MARRLEIEPRPSLFALVNPKFRRSSKSPKAGLWMVRILDDQVQSVFKHSNQEPVSPCGDSRRIIRQPQVEASAQVSEGFPKVRPLLDRA